MVSVLGGQPRFSGDDGTASPQVAAALDAFAGGAGSEHAVLAALVPSRLLVPVVAAAGGQHHGEMSLPTLVGRDGRPAIPGFTCLDAMAMWRPQARPVPVSAGQVWRAAVDESCAVVVDVAGPVPLAVDGERLAALADGRPVPLPHQDPDVLAEVRAAAAGTPAIGGFRLSPGQAGSDLLVEVALAGGCDPAAGQESVRLLGCDLMARLGSRMRRGIAIAVAPAADGNRRR